LRSELELGVSPEASGVPNVVDLHRVVDDELDRRSGLIFAVAAARPSRRASRRGRRRTARR
jgi:hypothetical protein